MMTRALWIVLMCYAVQAQNQRTPQPESANSNLPVQKVGPNDLIAVSVYDYPNRLAHSE